MGAERAARFATRDYTAGMDPAAANLRRRLQFSLVAGVGLGSTGYIGAITVATIVAKELSGGSALAGLPEIGRAHV
mgnify:FL=1